MAKSDRLRRIAAQEMPARDKQIGERTGDNEAMSVLSEPGIPIGCPTFARTFDLVRFFRLLDSHLRRRDGDSSG